MSGTYPLLLSPDDMDSSPSTSGRNDAEDVPRHDTTPDVGTEQTRHPDEITSALVMWFALNGGC